MFRPVACIMGICLTCLTFAPAWAQRSATTSASPTARTQLTYLQDASLQQDLKLSEEQIQRLRVARQQSTSLNGPSEAARQAVAATTELRQAAINEILTADQKKRFQQVLWQQQGRTNGPALFRDPAFLAPLSLNADQTSQVQAILQEDAKRASDYSASYYELIRTTRQLPAAERTQKLNEANAKNDEARKGLESRLQGLLTADQQAKYKESLGAPFAGTLSNRNIDDTGPRRAVIRLGANTAPLTRFFKEAQFREEMKITPEQAAKAADLPAIGNVEVTRLEQIFSPEQMQRGRELTLQNAVLVAGPTGPYRYRWVVDELKFTDEQRDKLQFVHDETYSHYISQATSSRFRAAPAANISRAELDRTVTERVAAIVSPEQQAKLKPLLGAPYQGPLLVTQPLDLAMTFNRLGSLDAPSVRFIREAQFHAELKLTPEQVQKAAALSTGRGATTNRPGDFLLPEQLRRANELTLQYSRQSSGPAGPLRYKFVIEALAPSEEQKTKLQAVLQETLPNSGRAAPANAQAAEERLAAILTAEQQAKLKELLGPAFAGDLAPAQPANFSSFYVIGRSSAPQMNLFGDAQVQDELKLNADQKRLAATATVPGRSSVEGMMFSAEQLKRARELTYQYARQAMGPAGVFLYAPLADDLQLTAEQRAGVQTLFSETAGQFFSMGRGNETAEQTAAKRKEQEVQIEERLAKILTPEQQARLKDLMGAPYAGRLTVTRRGSFGERGGFEGRGGSPGGAGTPGGGGRGGRGGDTTRTASEEP